MPDTRTLSPDLERRFPSHPLPKPTPETINAAGILRDASRGLAALIDDMLPQSREKSLALTHLEDASTYSVKAVYADKVEVCAAGESAPDDDLVLAIASVCHEVNRSYCEALGDLSQKPWIEAPQWQRDSAVAGVRLHLESPWVGPEASHNSWMAAKFDAGWIYGPEKNEERKTHPCLVPFAELPREQQAKDFIFRAVVHATHKALVGL